MDYRIPKTIQALSSAMITLLEKQSFSKITVNEICEEAMVSRSTFYSHFEDKYKLLQFSIQEIEQIVFPKVRNMNLEELLFAFLENIQDNKKVLRNLMIAELDIELMEMLRQHFVSIFIEILKEQNLDNTISQAKAEVLASFYSAGISQTVALWIEKKLPISAQEMAKTLSELLQGVEQD